MGDRDKAREGAAPIPIAVIQRLIKAVERLGSDNNSAEPLYGGHGVPAGDDCPKRESVGRGKFLAIHLVGEQDIRLGFAQRHASGIRDLAGWSGGFVDYALVGAVENHFDRACLWSRAFEEGRKR